jgi:transposase
MNNLHCHTNKSKTDQGAPLQHEAIYLGVDQDKKFNTVTRIIDQSTPQPAQKLTWDRFFVFVAKQLTLAKKVYVVYEAGAFGFDPCRKIRALGAECFVVHPEKLDPRQKRVQTDKLDSRHLADKLQRYILGNKRAMVPVYVPTPAEEWARVESRHRKRLAGELKSHQARGRGLLLSQGIFEVAGWWKNAPWQELKEKLCAELVRVLEDVRASIQHVQQQLTPLEKKLEASAPKALPRGFGRLTFVLLTRELCNYQRFNNRRSVAGFTGLCGAVSSSGAHHAELSINKAGSPYLRTLLVELAWRMIYWQPGYRGLKVWNRTRAEGGGTRRRKMALVAVARQLAVDIWRWQLGQVTPEELGWQMTPTA